MVRRRIALLAALTLGLGTAQGMTGADAGPLDLTVTSTENGVTVSQLASTLGGSGVTVSNVAYTGAANAAGTFTGGASAVGFDSGIVLSSGSVQSDAAHSEPAVAASRDPTPATATPPTTTQWATPTSTRCQV